MPVGLLEHNHSLKEMEWQILWTFFSQGITNNFYLLVIDLGSTSLSHNAEHNITPSMTHVRVRGIPMRLNVLTVN